MIIQNVLNQASEKLKKNKIKTSLLDSEILMCKVLDKSREELILNDQITLNSSDLQNFNDLIDKRAKGKPIAYLLKKKSFWKYEFIVEEGILIPRPDTEIIVDEINKIFKNKSNLNILEIGVGSGCILLSVLKENINFRGIGIDLDKKCINICKINAEKLNVINRLKLVKSDVDKFNNGKYDLIISNPPYIRKLDLKYLDKEVANFEPKLALDGGLDGTSIISKVINKSSLLIKKNGKLMLEIAFNQTKEVKKLLKNKGFYINRIVKDFANNDRCIISTKI